MVKKLTKEQKQQVKDKIENKFLNILQRTTNFSIPDRKLTRTLTKVLHTFKDELNQEIDKI